MDIVSADTSNSSRFHIKPVGTKKTQRRRKLDQRFIDYIRFGFPSTVCLGIFVGCYVILLLVLWPLLMETAGTPAAPLLSNEHGSDAGHHVHLPPALRQVAQHDKEVFSAMAGAVKQRLQKLRQGRGTTDAALIDQTKLEFEQLRRQKLAVAAHSAEVEHRKNIAEVAILAGNDRRHGFMVLGMHRSGTSMLSGLLVSSCGYKVGGPLIGSAFDNEKGFFERIDIVLQNDEFMRKQRIDWESNVINYDWERALKDKESGVADFEKYGKPGLAFLDNPSNVPWLQKDPRMCITLKTWLKLMNSEPAIVFTYRHPMEVAMSLHRRQKTFTLEHGLRLWIVYNMRAIQNSRGLCVVYSSNDAVLADPMNEIQRIADEITTKCNVPEPPYRLKQEDVDKFIDPDLQHNKNKRAEEEMNKEVIATYNDGKCIVRAYDSDEPEGSDSRQRETKLYGWAMKIYCDFQSGEAYKESYNWPVLP